MVNNSYLHQKYRFQPIAFGLSWVFATQKRKTERAFYSISISNLNVVGVFKSERAKADTEHLIID